MNNLRIMLFLVLSLMTGSMHLTAQENCALNLKLAQELLSSGQIEKIPSLIEPCISSGFTREEKIVAYKVLLNAFLFDENPEKAQGTMLNFLKSYPEYQPISTDPSEFVDLMEQFDNKPRFSVGIIAGGTYSVIRNIESINTSSFRGNYGNYQTSAIGYHAGFTLIKYLNSKIDICIEADYKSTVFDYSVNPDAFTVNTYNEFQSVLNFPLSATYTFGNWKYAPFTRLGINPGLLISSGADLVISPGAESPRVSKLGSREPFNLWGILGGGVKLKLSRSYIFLDIRYNFALNNQVNKSGRNLTQNDEIWVYRHRDGSFYHDDLNFSIGYVKTIYKPRKNIN